MYTGQQLRVPQRLDDPPKFLFWDMDISLIVITAFGIGLFTHQLIVLTSIGLFIAYRYTKFKSGKHPYFMIHSFFWFLPIKRKSKRIPDSSVREFLR